MMILQFVAMATLAAAPAPAQPTQGAGAAIPAKEKKICKSAPPTGSLFAARVCRTQAEWDELAAKSKDELNKTGALETTR